MQNNTILSNLLAFIPRHKFNKIVKKHNGDKYSKHITVYDHFVAMIYGVISNATSLRDIEARFNSNHKAFLSVKSKAAFKSTLSHINNKESSLSIYQELFYKTLNLLKDNLDKEDQDRMINIIDATEIKLNSNAKDCYPDRNKNNKAKIKVHVVTEQSTSLPKEVYFSKHNVNDITIAKNLIEIKSNNTYVFDRGYYDFTWWHKIDNKSAFFVTKLKKNTKVVLHKELRKDFATKDIIGERYVYLGKKSSSARHSYSKKLKEVLIRDTRGKLQRVITNNLSLTAEEVASLYRSRWEIEIFFKWLKQNLRIKKFYGNSATAIKVQIYIAMIAYILLRQLKSDNQFIKQDFTKFVSICKTHLMTLCHSIIAFFIPPPQTNNKNNQRGINTNLTLFKHAY